MYILYILDDICDDEDRPLRDRPINIESLRGSYNSINIAVLKLPVLV